MQNECRVARIRTHTHASARPRAHGGSPVLFLTFRCQDILGSEQRATVLCEYTTCKEITDRDRLPDQQPVHLQKKEATNREANNFYLKSCPAHWVHLNTSGLMESISILDSRKTDPAS